LVPVPPKPLRSRIQRRRLACRGFAHGNQSAPRSHRPPNAAASTASRPAFVTIAIRPSYRGGMSGMKHLIWGWSQENFGKSEITACGDGQDQPHSPHPLRVRDDQDTRLVRDCLCSRERSTQMIILKSFEIRARPHEGGGARWHRVRRFAGWHKVGR
jgi:hypothetical protein